MTGYSNGETIEVGKTYNGATVVEIAPGADKYSSPIVKFTGCDGAYVGGNGIHQCSEEYFVRNFIKQKL